MVEKMLMVSMLLAGTVYATEPFCQHKPVIFCNDFDLGSWDGMEHEGDANLIAAGQPGQHVFRGTAPWRQFSIRTEMARASVFASQTKTSSTSASTCALTAPGTG